jgi:chemotaxis signal transduction protein
MDEHRRQSEIRTLDQSHSISENLLQLVSFRIGNEEFGLDILRVQEIIRLQDLTRVPNAPDFVDGVINLRGKVIPIIALRKRFGLQQQPHDRQTRIVVLEVQNMCWASLWIRIAQHRVNQLMFHPEQGPSSYNAFSFQDLEA